MQILHEGKHVGSGTAAAFKLKISDCGSGAARRTRRSGAGLEQAPLTFRSDVPSRMIFVSHEVGHSVVGPVINESVCSSLESA